MNKENVKKALAEKTKLSQKDAKVVLDGILNTVVANLKGEATSFNKEAMKKALAETLKVSQKEAKSYLDAFLAVISEGLRGEDGNFVEGVKVQLTGFGTFLVKMRQGKPWVLPAGKDGKEKSGVSENKLVVSFKAGTMLTSSEENVFTVDSKVQLTGFGSFSVRMRQGKPWKLTDKDGNVKTGVSEAKAVVSFKAGSLLSA